MNTVTKIAAAALLAVGMAATQVQAQSQPPVDPAPLTPAQVKTVVEGRLIMHRSDLKVGKVTEKDAKTYDVELVKPDGIVQEHALVDKSYARPAGALSPMGHGFGPGGKQGHMGMGGGMGMGCGQPG
ncbi:MAG: hypothetical protein H7Z12_16895 [Rhodospirillaceae bacterium]|nr:hypothetical protein [Rhodospirillales bacterium]